MEITEDRPQGITKKSDIRHRFNNEGRARLQQAQELNNILTEHYPWFVGVSVFGSSTKASSTKNSVFDINYFYDSSGINQEDVNKALESEYIEETVKKDLEAGATDEEAKRALNRDACISLVTRELGVADFNSVNRDFFIDVSEDSLDINIQSAVSLVDAKNQDAEVEWSPAMRDLARMFMLMPRSRLSNKRRYVLDSLEEDPKGEQAFNLIMNKLANYERRPENGEIQYEHYPTSISEARSHFCNN